MAGVSVATGRMPSQTMPSRQMYLQEAWAESKLPSSSLHHAPDLQHVRGLAAWQAGSETD